MGDIGRGLQAFGAGLGNVANTIMNAQQQQMQADEHANKLELLKQQKDELEFNKATSRVDMGLKLKNPKLIEDYFNGVGKPYIEKVFGQVSPEFIKYFASKQGSEKARAVADALIKNPKNAKEFIENFVASGATYDPAVANEAWSEYLELQKKEVGIAKDRSDIGTGGELGKRAFTTAQSQVQDIDSSVAKIASENPGVDRNRVLMRELANRGVSLSVYRQKKAIAETGDVNAQPVEVGPNNVEASSSKDEGGRVFNPNSFKEETDLRKEFQTTGLYKNFSEQATGFDKVKDGFENPSAVGDIGMIYGYMKLIDPSSSVKEGEVALAEQAKGIPSQVLGLYNKAVKGQRLGQDVRQDFYNKALSQVDKAKKRYSKFANQYTKIANGRGLNPENVVVPIFDDGDQKQAAPDNKTVFDDLLPK